MTTRTEGAAQSVLENALEGTSWKIAVKPRLQDVIDRDGKGLLDEEFSLYTRGHFDFVVYGGKDRRPEFAVELDGPTHAEPETAARDILKNWLVGEADLPLLRLGPSELQFADQIEVLAALAARFVCWKTHLERIGGNHIGQAAGPEGIREIAIIEQALSEIRLPPNVEIARRLHKLGICVGREIADHRPEADIPYLLIPIWPGKRRTLRGASSEFVEVRLVTYVRSARSPSRLMQVTGTGRFSAALQVDEDEYWDPEVPWLDPEWIALELALLDSLRQTEVWAKANATSLARD